MIIHQAITIPGSERVRIVRHLLEQDVAPVHKHVEYIPPFYYYVCMRAFEHGILYPRRFQRPFKARGGETRPRVDHEACARSGAFVALLLAVRPYSISMNSNFFNTSLAIIVPLHMVKGEDSSALAQHNQENPSPKH